MHKFENRLYNALSLAHGDATRDQLEHLDALGKPPMMGWDAEKWRQHHVEGAAAAEQAARWLFIRLMQIDPD